MPQLALLAVVFFFVFGARIVPSPLLPAIATDLHLTHARAASLFLFLSVGYGVSTLLSGFISARIGHRLSMFIGVAGGSLGLLAAAFSPSLGLLRASVAFIGMSTGLYLPSAVPAVTSLVPAGEQGRALAVHELAPNLAFVLIPLLAAALLPLLAWRGFLIVLAASGLAVGVVFLIRGRTGRSRGEPPSAANLRLILSRPAFWSIAALFALGVGSGVGVFSILPSFLVAERGLDPTLVNVLLGLSRASGLGAVFLAGWLADRFGAPIVLAAVLVVSGLTTAALGFTRGALLIAAVFAQPVLTACFFPVGFAAIARITSRRIYNVTLSLVLPIAYTLGGGVAPSLLGVLGDRGAFALGLILLGALIACGSPVALRLRLLPREA